MERGSSHEPISSGSPLTRSQSEGHSGATSRTVSTPHDRLARYVPVAMMNYHLDDIDIPLVDDQCDPSVVPSREIADEYFDAYMTFVHPHFSALRRTAFTAQYQHFFSRSMRPPRKWLAILNMVFAIGCRHCRLMNPSNNDIYDNDLIFLTRARQLGLSDNILFEHTELQQIQLEFLVAVYLLCLGQPNRYAALVLSLCLPLFRY